MILPQNGELLEEIIATARTDAPQSASLQKAMRQLLEWKICHETKSKDTFVDLGVTSCQKMGGDTRVVASHVVPVLTQASHSSIPRDH